MVRNIGSEPCEFVGALDAVDYKESSPSQWLSHAPRALLAANLGLPVSALQGPGTEQRTFCSSG